MKQQNPIEFSANVPRADSGLLTFLFTVPVLCLTLFIVGVTTNYTAISGNVLYAVLAALTFFYTGVLLARTSVREPTFLSVAAILFLSASSGTLVLGTAKLWSPTAISFLDTPAALVLFFLFPLAYTCFCLTTFGKKYLGSGLALYVCFLCVTIGGSGTFAFLERAKYFAITIGSICALFVSIDIFFEHRGLDE